MYEAYIQWLESNMTPCVYVSFFGVECPGCGIQRAFVLLMKGDLMGSLKMHPGLIPLIGLMGYTFLHLVKRFKNGGKVILYWMIVFLGITLTNYIVHQVDHFAHVH